MTFLWLCLFMFSLSIIQRRQMTLSSQNTSFKTTLIWSKGGSLGAQRGTVSRRNLSTAVEEDRKSLVLFTIRFSLWPSLPSCAIMPIFIALESSQKWESKIAWLYSYSQKASFHKMSNRLLGKLLESCFFFSFLFKLKPIFLVLALQE